MSTSALIDVPYADARAADLGYLLGLAPLPALKTLAVRAAGRVCELRILGCSHQLLVDRGALLSETVACLPGLGADAPRPRPLPARHEQHLPGGLRYALRSSVGRLSDRVPGQLDALVAAHAADPRGLVGIFPGDRHAFTALALREPRAGAIAWETFHAYPQSDEIVHTHSTLEPLPR